MTAILFKYLHIWACDVFTFCRQSVLAFMQMVDAITGKVMSSMVIILALKFHCDT
jgi:hypothetical protein